MRTTTVRIRKDIPIVSLQLVRDRTVKYGTSQMMYPHSIYNLFTQIYGEPDRELFVIVCLDTRHKPTAISTISQGTLNSSLVHPREVFKTAMLANAAAIALIHNHPSGDSSPSPEDIAVTKRLAKAGELLDIKVLDHIVIGDNQWTSLLQRGLM